MKYTPMQIQCDLSESSFDAAMGTMNVPVYLHVHPSLLERAKEILTKRATPHHVIALADESITNVNEWYLVTAIGSSPP